MPAVLPELFSDPCIKKSPTPIMQASDLPYPCSLVFNAGVIKYNGEYVMIFRNDYGTDKERVFTMDLTKSTGIYASPAYYIQQGDLIYVTPNKKKLRESTVIGNTTLTPSFWISLVSSVTSIAVSLAVLMSK